MRSLRSHPEISDAATVARADDRTVAYVVPAHAGVDIDTAGVRKYLAERLPRYMLPAGIAVLAELPKTVSGKLDSSVLPEWSPTRPRA